MNRIYIFIAILLCSINISIAQPLVKVTPEEVGLDNNQLRSGWAIDILIEHNKIAININILFMLSNALIFSQR